MLLVWCRLRAVVRPDDAATDLFRPGVVQLSPALRTRGAGCLPPPKSHARRCDLQRSGTSGALSPLPTEAGAFGQSTRNRFGLGQADPETQGETRVAVRTRGVHFEEKAGDLRDQIASPESRHKEPRSASYELPRKSRGGERTSARMTAL